MENSQMARLANSFIMSRNMDGPSPPLPPPTPLLKGRGLGEWGRTFGTWGVPKILPERGDNPEKGGLI